MTTEAAPRRRKALCPKCFERIPPEAKRCPHCGAGQTAPVVPVFLVILLIATSVLLMSSTYVTTSRVSKITTEPSEPIQAVAVVKPTETPVVPPKEMSQAAYDAAKKFALEKFPSARRISDLRESPVAQKDDVYQVTLFIDVDQGGAPVRNAVLMKVRYDQGKWSLKDIGQ